MSGNTPGEPRGFKEMVVLQAMNVGIAYEDEGKLLATLKVKPNYRSTRQGPFLSKNKRANSKGQVRRFQYWS